MEKKPIAIVIPSYNNIKWYEKNLNSVLNQNYSNYRIIYTDDNSPDKTGEKVKEFIDKHDTNNIVELNLNKERLGALHNLYNMFHYCDDNEIVVTIDGDDFLANNDVLNRINQEYQNPDVWMTWGSYLDYPKMTRGCCKPYEKQVIKNNSYRKVIWRASHLRTMYSWLFKKIKKEDFLYKGKWCEAAWDLCFCFPALEMCAGHFSYIHDILYYYNNDNPISDFRIKQSLQVTIDRHMRAKPPYKPLKGVKL